MVDLGTISLALAGLAITLYINIARIANKPVICPIDGNCNAVLESKWSKIFGIKNDVIGMLYYIAVILGLYFIDYSIYIPSLLKLAGTLSALMSIFLLIIQVKVIKKYCIWCIAAASINMTLFVLLMRL